MKLLQIVKKIAAYYRTDSLKKIGITLLIIGLLIVTPFITYLKNSYFSNIYNQYDKVVPVTDSSPMPSPAASAF